MRGVRPFKVVIPSANVSNLRKCVGSLLDREPSLLGNIIVVNDGAREGWPNAPVEWVEGIKPFVFARNCNRGLVAACTDIFLMNDDAGLITPNGFTILASSLRGERKAQPVGVCSVAIDGFVGNPNQRVREGWRGWQEEKGPLAFICVFIPWSTSVSVGPLDERFVGYGSEDVDYCDRVRAEGLTTGIFGGCVVKHGLGPSTYRTKPDIDALTRHNRLLLRDKFFRREK